MQHKYLQQEKTGVRPSLDSLDYEEKSWYSAGWSRDQGSRVEGYSCWDRRYCSGRKMVTACLARGSWRLCYRKPHTWLHSSAPRCQHQLSRKSCCSASVSLDLVTYSCRLLNCSSSCWRPNALSNRIRVWSIPILFPAKKQNIRVLLKNYRHGDAPGGPMMKNLPSSAGEASSTCGWGTKSPHGTGLPSL